MLKKKKKYNNGTDPRTLKIQKFSQLQVQIFAPRGCPAFQMPVTIIRWATKG